VGLLCGDDLNGGLHVLQLQLSSPPITPLAPIKSQMNGDILVAANPGPPGKWPLRLILHRGPLLMWPIFHDDLGKPIPP